MIKTFDFIKKIGYNTQSIQWIADKIVHSFFRTMTTLKKMNKQYAPIPWRSPSKPKETKKGDHPMKKALSFTSTLMISIVIFYLSSLLIPGSSFASDASVLRIETGMHTAIIRRIGIDAQNRFLTMVPEITFRNIQFDLGSAKIRKKSIPQLNEIGAALQEINSPITISGHTDKQPFKGYTPQESVPLNLNLSKNRAKAVADFLINMGISRNRIKTHGFGSKNPVAHGDTDADYAKNRRVVIGVND
jgi:flagellar motor protein MotB